MQRIGLKTAQAHVEAGCRSIQIVEGPRGYTIQLNDEVLRSQREDELTFLTVDGAVNYVRRHLASPHGLTTSLTLVLSSPDEH